MPEQHRLHSGAVRALDVGGPSVSNEERLVRLASRRPQRLLEDPQIRLAGSGRLAREKIVEQRIEPAELCDLSEGVLVDVADDQLFL